MKYIILSKSHIAEDNVTIKRLEQRCENLSCGLYYPDLIDIDYTQEKFLTGENDQFTYL